MWFGHSTAHPYTFEIATWGGLVNMYLNLFNQASVLSIFSASYVVIHQVLWPLTHFRFANYLGFDNISDFIILDGAKAVADMMPTAEPDVETPRTGE